MTTPCRMSRACSGRRGVRDHEGGTLMSKRSRALVRATAKSVLAGGMYYTGVLSSFKLARRLCGAPRVQVLAYHRVVPDFARATQRCLAPLCVSRATFEAQLAYVTRHMDVLDLDSATLTLRGARRLRRDGCLITFDDGY